MFRHADAGFDERSYDKDFSKFTISLLKEGICSKDPPHQHELFETQASLLVLGDTPHLLMYFSFSITVNDACKM